jgi:hypothetical protein
MEKDGINIKTVDDIRNRFTWFLKFIIKNKTKNYIFVQIRNRQLADEVTTSNNNQPQQNDFIISRSRIDIMNKPVIEELNKFYTENRPKEGLQYISSIFDSNYIINEKILLVVAKNIVLVSIFYQEYL